MCKSLNNIAVSQVCALLCPAGLFHAAALCLKVQLAAAIESMPIQIKVLVAINLMWSLHGCVVYVQDFSDLVAQKAAQQKRKAAQAKESGKSKKQKSDTFKF